MLESELYEHMTIAEEERPESAKEPALMLLWEFFSVSANTNAAGMDFIVRGEFTNLFLLLKIRDHKVLDAWAPRT